ncbi:chloride channel protein [Alphaproteobacteria bacterium]|nr:chloride channel protein [Alphaproteobacteria bacterium]
MIKVKNQLFNLITSNVALVFVAIFTGLIVSCVAQIFMYSGKKVFELLRSDVPYDFLNFVLFDQQYNFVPLIIGILAAILIGLLIKYQKIDRFHGPADTIYAAHQIDGQLDVRKGFLSTLTSLISIGGGASVGIYGPLVHFGGTFAAFMRRQKFIPKIPHDIIIGSGVAAAISAAFGAPLAGILFAHEVIIRHFSKKGVAAIALSSVSANFLAVELGMVTYPLRFEENSFELMNSIPGLIVTGIISAFAALSFMKSLLYSGVLSSKINIPAHYKPIIPGVLCGLFGIFLPIVIGLGSSGIMSFITLENSFLFLLIILIVKIILTSSCIGFGLFGGIFSPALFVGAATGALIYNVPFLGDDLNLLSIFAVSGMAAVSSSVIGAPITAIILVLELTGSYNYAIVAMLPIGICNLITYLSFGASYFDVQLKNRKILIDEGREHILLSQTKVLNYIDQNYSMLNKDITTDAAIKILQKNNTTEGYFIDSNKNYLGKINLINLINSKSPKAFQLREKNHIILSPSHSVLETIEKLSNFVGESIPIVNSENNKMLGIISENDVLDAYIKLSNEIKNIEKK